MKTIKKKETPNTVSLWADGAPRITIEQRIDRVLSYRSFCPVSVATAERLENGRCKLQLFYHHVEFVLLYFVAVWTNMRSTPKCEFVFTVKLVVWVTLCGSNLRGFTKGGFIYFCDKDRNICHKVWIIFFLTKWIFVEYKIWDTRHTNNEKKKCKFSL